MLTHDQKLKILIACKDKTDMQDRENWEEAVREELVDHFGLLDSHTLEEVSEYMLAAIDRIHSAILNIKV